MKYLFLLVRLGVPNIDELLLVPSWCKKRQKSPNQETGSGYRGRLKVPNDTKLILNY